MFKVLMCAVLAVGVVSAATHRSVVKVLCPDTTATMKLDTTKVTKGDTTTFTIVNKQVLSISIDTLVITTDTVKVKAKKAEPAKAGVPAKPALKK